MKSSRNRNFKKKKTKRKMDTEELTVSKGGDEMEDGGGAK